jgi:hypothetical protein
VIKRPRKPLLLAVAAALCLGGTAYAEHGGYDGFGRPSVTPPPHSHGHCKDGSKPPCKIGGAGHGTHGYDR